MIPIDEEDNGDVLAGLQQRSSVDLLVSEGNNMMQQEKISALLRLEKDEKDDSYTWRDNFAQETQLFNYLLL